MKTTALAAVFAAFGGFLASPALADDAGSVRLQSPGGWNTGSGQAPGMVTRDAGLFGFGGLASGVSGPDAAERERRLRGDFPDGN